MNQCIPSKVIRPNDKAWYDFEIRIFSKYRDRQRPIPLVSNTPSSWSKYKTLQNKVNNLKTFAKQKFLTNIENNIETLPVGNSKCYWKAIKDLMKHYKSPDSIPILKRSADCNEELCFEDLIKLTVSMISLRQFPQWMTRILILPYFNRLLIHSLIMYTFLKLTLKISSLDINTAFVLT
mgnify:CR=1 FL=1